LARLVILELRISAGAEDELAAHGVTADEALEVSWHDPYFVHDKVEGRHLMIGQTDAGRLLTIVIEPTATFGIVDVVTGWPSSKGERTVWQKSQPKGRT